jgi:hypothetical protein
VLPSSCGVAIADSKKSCACPPLAGGCEKVVAVGGGIRTGAGTGVELDKKNEADRAAENIGWAGRAAEGKKLAGRAAAEQANCIWLISGETMTLNFLKKSMPRMGPTTAACSKVDVKSLPWNCTVF